MLAHMRYSVPTIFLLASAFAALVGSPREAGPSARASARGWVFVGHTVAVIVLCFAIIGYRGLGPGWREHLRRAAPAARRTPRCW